MPKGDTEVEVPVGGGEVRAVRITSPGKVFFPQRGETKLDLVGYYLAVGEAVMAAMGGRPTLLQRFPEGATGKSFFQKRVPESRPDWLRTATVSTPNGTTSEALLAADLAHLVWAVNLGCLGFHPWPFKADRPESTDELRIDLDPSPGIVYPQVRDTAHLARELLGELGLRCLLKTSGSRGLHLYARLQPGWDSYDVRAAAVAFARELERRHPDLVTARWWKEERGSRVFIDFNQNAPHKTVFGAWSVRSRTGGQVSTPVSWDELDAIVPDELTIATVPERLAASGDPWSGPDAEPQSLEPLLALAARDAAEGLADEPWPPVYPKMPHEPPRVAPSRARPAD